MNTIRVITRLATMLAGLIAPRIRLGFVSASISCEHCRSSRNNPHCAPGYVIYYFNSWCCILDYFILNCKLWDKLLISVIILTLIIPYILIFYRNFELIFEFMALKRAPICGRNVCLSFFFCVFLYLIVIIVIEENKKNLTLSQNNEKWTKILILCLFINKFKLLIFYIHILDEFITSDTYKFEKPDS